MLSLDAQTLMFTNAVVAGSVAAMTVLRARGYPGISPVVRAWGRLMSVLALGSFAWFVNGPMTFGLLSLVGNLLFSLVPALGLVAFGRLAGKSPNSATLLLLTVPGVVGVLSVWSGAPRFIASVPIGTAFAFAAAWSLVLLALQQRARPSPYRLALLLTLVIVVLLCTARVVAASTGFHNLVVPLAGSLLQTLTVLSATLFITAGSVSVFGLLEETRLAQVAEEGRRDGLTGVLLRKPFLEKSVGVLARTQVGFSVIVLDLDWFKLINDRHGHATGDAVLRDCANVLRECVREGDLIARFGGEEFAVMLPRCELGEACEVAQRLLERFRERRVMSTSGQLVLYSASVGVAQGDTGLEATLAVQEALEQADAAMYRAKQTGRDRVAVWSKNMPEVEFSVDRDGAARSGADS